jgi:hypothetical protein
MRPVSVRLKAKRERDERKARERFLRAKRQQDDFLRFSLSFYTDGERLYRWNGQEVKAVNVNFQNSTFVVRRVIGLLRDRKWPKRRRSREEDME